MRDKEDYSTLSRVAHIDARFCMRRYARRAKEGARSASCAAAVRVREREERVMSASRARLRERFMRRDNDL